MLPSLGNFILWVTFIFSIMQFFVVYKKKIYVFNSPKLIATGLLASSLISFFLLVFYHVVSDFSIQNVYQNSHTTKPLLYKITGVWGNHEGSMLLWILVLAIFNFLISKLQNKENINLISKALEIQALITASFILFTILTSNPFIKILPEPINGLGFNPVLQDPALAIHPPLLYIGYVGFSAVFSLSVATLVTNNSKSLPWFNYIKPFVLASWTFLTLGIALGSIWAYYELGWGGWWFWDPVENASFMPWLLGTALLHSLIIVEKKRMLQTWVLLLSILTFLLSVIGTFLVRSGILTSVHAFALDPSRGMYILLFTALLGGYSLFIFSTNAKRFFVNNYFSFFSREGAILVNNVLMIIVCGVVFLGTIYPLIIEALTNNKISVGEPYFNSTVVPIILPALLIMGVGPILSWGQESKKKFFDKISINFFISIIITLIILLIYKSSSFIGFFGIMTATWIICNSISMLLKKKRSSSLGMITSHFGVGLLIIGITASSTWQNEKIIKIKMNKSILINDYKIFLEKINEIEGPNYVALQGIFSVIDKKNNTITRLRPERRFYPVSNVFTTEASIHTNLLRDLYIVLGEGDSNNGWIVRIYYNPLVIWIWIGAITIFIGGLISISNNLKKLKK